MEYYESFVKTLIVLVILLVGAIIGIGIRNSIVIKYEERTLTAEKQSQPQDSTIQKLHSYKLPQNLPHTNHTPPNRVIQSKPTGSWETYNTLKRTCNFWTKDYNKTRSEIARVNMNQGCKYAADYALNELNATTKVVNYATYKNSERLRNKNSSRSSTHRNYENINRNSFQCELWKKEKENIQNQLRSGYREPTGNRLRARKNKLFQMIAKNC